jgi:hypothetical protein
VYLSELDPAYISTAPFALIRQPLASTIFGVVDPDWFAVAKVLEFRLKAEKSSQSLQTDRLMIEAVKNTNSTTRNCHVIKTLGIFWNRNCWCIIWLRATK